MTSAIPFALLCNLLYAVGYALAKWLSGSLDPLEITFLRSALVLVAAMGVTGVRPGRAAAWQHALAPPRARDQRLAACALIAPGMTRNGVFGYAMLRAVTGPGAAIEAPGGASIAAGGRALLLREAACGADQADPGGCGQAEPAAPWA